jgi:hypothetical protein
VTGGVAIEAATIRKIQVRIAWSRWIRLSATSSIACNRSAPKAASPPEISSYRDIAAGKP